MPIVRRKAKRTVWTELHAEALEHGCQLGPDEWRENPRSPATPGIRREQGEAWEVFRDGIMAKYPDLQRPGCRPWAWWLFDAPEGVHDAQTLYLAGLMGEDELLHLWQREQRHAKAPQTLPYRRHWTWWLFASVEPRDPAQSELDQLIATGQLTDLEQLILDDKTHAKRVGEGDHSRFWLRYLDDGERRRLGLADF